jgi:acetylglutamate kinase
MKTLLVIKIGGHVIDEAEVLDRFLKALAAVSESCLLVHGGGKLATRLSEQLGIKTQLVEGRRLTDAATLEVVKQVYGGSINKQLVAQLQAIGKNAIGLTGADGDLVRAQKRQHPSIDFGFVGDITNVNTVGFEQLLKNRLLPVMAPLTHDGKGQLLNTNADTMAGAIAVALSSLYKITLIYGFEKSGVLRDRNDPASVIDQMNRKDYAQLKAGGLVNEGMIPKLDNAFEAISAGVDRVILGKADQLPELLDGKAGTTLSNE